MEVEMIGGSRDGAKVSIPDTSRELRVPVINTDAQSYCMDIHDTITPLLEVEEFPIHRYPDDINKVYDWQGSVRRD